MGFDQSLNLSYTPRQQPLYSHGTVSRPRRSPSKLRSRPTFYLAAHIKSAPSRGTAAQETHHSSLRITEPMSCHSTIRLPHSLASSPVTQATADPWWPPRESDFVLRNGAMRPPPLDRTTNFTDTATQVSNRRRRSWAGSGIHCIPCRRFAVGIPMTPRCLSLSEAVQSFIHAAALFFARGNGAAARLYGLSPHGGSTRIQVPGRTCTIAAIIFRPTVQLRGSVS